MNIIQLVKAAGVFSLIIILMKQEERVAYAEGSKNFNGAEGVNRVVRTPSKGFYEVNGGGYMTFSGLPYDAKGAYTGPTGEEYKDKPSFYLGGACGGSQLDAGLQYEPKPLNDILPGWSAFISKGDVFSRPQVWAIKHKASVPWRGTRGAPKAIRSGVTFKFNSDNTAQVTIGIIAVGKSTKQINPSNGIFFWNGAGGVVNGKKVLKAYADKPVAPCQGQQAFTGDTKKANVKSVIAMTRKTGEANLDGAQLTGSWSALNITDASGNYVWTSAYVNQKVTGYDAPGNGKGKAKDGLGAWKVDFSTLNVTSKVARTDTHASRAATTGSAAGSPSRYTGETVNIFLRNPPPKGKGKPVHHK